MKILARAKINLSLDVTGKREDGYHTLDSVMQSVQLCDEVEIDLKPAGGIEIACGAPNIPRDERNSAYKAAKNFLSRIEMPGQGVWIGIGKKIPSRAGLGGGSADAAAVLLGLNRLMGSPLDEDSLISLAAGVGADVPFCLTGGTKRCEGIGEKLSPASPLPDCLILICKPEAGVSTPEAYRALDAESAQEVRRTPALLRALEGGELYEISQRLYNRFDETLKIPEVLRIKDILKKGGALGELMTGSGSAVFGIFESLERAREARRSLRGLGVTYLTRPALSGLEII